MDSRTKQRLLLVDNNPGYRHSLLDLLELEGYTVSEAGTAGEAQERLGNGPFDLALVDVRMRNDDDTGDFTGLEIARRASAIGIPCIIVTSYATVEIARMSLRARGAKPFAEDLVTKASGPEALLDAIRLILSRRQSRPSKKPNGGLAIDTEMRVVTKNGKKVKLSGKQYDLLEALYLEKGRLCKSAQLIEAVYHEKVSDTDAQNDRRFKNLIDRLKDKIEAKPGKKNGKRHEYIEAEYGQGYRLNLKE